MGTEQPTSQEEALLKVRGSRETMIKERDDIAETIKIKEALIRSLVQRKVLREPKDFLTNEDNRAIMRYKRNFVDSLHKKGIIKTEIEGDETTLDELIGAHGGDAGELKNELEQKVNEVIKSRQMRLTLEQALRVDEKGDRVDERGNSFRVEDVLYSDQIESFNASTERIIEYDKKMSELNKGVEQALKPGSVYRKVDKDASGKEALANIPLLGKEHEEALKDPEYEKVKVAEEFGRQIEKFIAEAMEKSIQYHAKLEEMRKNEEERKGLLGEYGTLLETAKSLCKESSDKQRLDQLKYTDGSVEVYKNALGKELDNDPSRGLKKALKYLLEDEESVRLNGALNKNYLTGDEINNIIWHYRDSKETGGALVIRSRWNELVSNYHRLDARGNIRIKPVMQKKLGEMYRNEQLRDYLKTVKDLDIFSYLRET